LRPIAYHLSLVTLLSTVIGVACAQDYPSRPVRMLVGSTPGGGTDISARIIASKLTEYFGRQFVVENRPGATASIAGAVVATAQPDGHTLWACASSLTTNPYILPKLPYDAVKDFAPVSQLAITHNIMIAHPSLPVRTVKELIALARPRPGEIQYAGAGPGSNQHVSMELFLHMAGIKILHVPYKGQSPALLDVMAGHMHLMMSSLIAALPQVRNGRVRALGVTGGKRTIVAPDIPTIAESGLPGYEVLQWYGVLAPAGTPRDIVMKLNTAIVKGLQDAEVKDRYLRDGAETAPTTPEEFGAAIAAEIKKWGPVIKAAGIKAH
jgi:tripartite-type tricarboxylate transporter receptor subunit TctC